MFPKIQPTSLPLVLLLDLHDNLDLLAGNSNNNHRGRHSRVRVVQRVRDSDATAAEGGQVRKKRGTDATEQGRPDGEVGAAVADEGTGLACLFAFKEFRLPFSGPV